MNHRFEVLNISLVAGDQPTEVLQPRVRLLNDPSALVSSQLPPVLMCRHPVVLPPRDDRLYLTLHQKRTHRVAVIATVCNQPLRLVWATALTSASFHFDRVERFFKELDFRGRSRLHAYSERSTLAICQNHKLRSLTAFGLAHTVAPFSLPRTCHRRSTRSSESCEHR
jgi:hypothetical protein